MITKSALQSHLEIVARWFHDTHKARVRLLQAKRVEDLHLPSIITDVPRMVENGNRATSRAKELDKDGNFTELALSLFAKDYNITIADFETLKDAIQPLELTRFYKGRLKLGKTIKDRSEVVNSALKEVFDKIQQIRNKENIKVVLSGSVDVSYSIYLSVVHSLIFLNNAQKSLPDSERNASAREEATREAFDDELKILEAELDEAKKELEQFKKDEAGSIQNAKREQLEGKVSDLKKELADLIADELQEAQRELECFDYVSVKAKRVKLEERIRALQLKAARLEKAKE